MNIIIVYIIACRCILKILEINVLKYMNLILLILLSAPRLAWQPCLKKRGVKLELLTNTDMLMMIEWGTRGRICHAVYRYAKTISTWKIIIKTLNYHTSCI